MIYRELLAGCGSNRDKKVNIGNGKDWQNLVTLDFNSDHSPDFVWDLEQLPLPFDDNYFDEIHLYEVLEHTGAQGDWKFFFKQFEEFHRIMKPDGHLCATVPMWNAIWAFGDPSHKRIINEGTLIFLSQQSYEENAAKKGPMSDFRQWYKGNFIVEKKDEYYDVFWFILKSIK